MAARGEAVVALALTRLEPAVRLVDDVDAAFTTDHAVIAMARAQGLQGISDFHNDTG